MWHVLDIFWLAVMDVFKQQGIRWWFDNSFSQHTICDIKSMQPGVSSQLLCTIIFLLKVTFLGHFLPANSTVHCSLSGCIYIQSPETSIAAIHSHFLVVCIPRWWHRSDLWRYCIQSIGSRLLFPCHIDPSFLPIVLEARELWVNTISPY